MKKQFLFGKLVRFLIFFALVSGYKQNLYAQDITTYQYRHVAPDKMAEFIKRETTYWSKVAKDAIAKGNLTFWGLFQKIGGSDDADSPNFLFINTFKNIDGNMGNIWNATKAFPGTPLAKMETNSISTTTSTVFLSDDGWQQSAKAVPDKDFNYVVMNYHNSSDPAGFVALEKKYWGPFIKTTMDNNQVSQVAWGNSIVLSPRGGNMKFNSVSADLFPTLKAALMPGWSSNVTFPTQGLDSLQKISLSPSDAVIYKIIKVETK